jgi:sugar phosphate isomerase/epimerase
MNIKPAAWQQLPFRLGTTSYIIPADILPNAHYLADKIDDIELVLFEVDNEYSNIPDAAVTDELKKIAKANDLSYTVHLPLDLMLGDVEGEEHLSIIKARKVIQHTKKLAPWSYVVHLDGKSYLANPTKEEHQKVIDNSCRALEIIGKELDGQLDLLAVENLDHYPPDFIFPVLERLPVSQCVDIGHLWLEGHDPVAYLQDTLPRTRVMHLHGIADRDHKSLKHMPAEKVKAVWDVLTAAYSGVVTLEIFSQADFESSLAVLTAIMEA